jgi:hypothetical protein
LLIVNRQLRRIDACLLHRLLLLLLLGGLLPACIASCLASLLLLLRALVLCMLHERPQRLQPHSSCSKSCICASAAPCMDLR